ncbi:MAG: hypothetical protein K2Q25_10225 [Mycobacteriaceae bacterium]|nr:hypothetical protein [Mycobacteriaceae bacterium]
MTVTPIVDHALAEGWIWISQLGRGLPESGALYVDSSKILDRIADAMAANVVHSHWEGLAASRSVGQGQVQWNAVVALEEVDRSVAAVTQEQANAVVSARSAMYDTQAALLTAKNTAEMLHNTGLVLAATSCELAAAKQATSTVDMALSLLADRTRRHANMVSRLNKKLTLLVTNLESSQQTFYSTLPASDLTSVNALKNSANTLRVNIAELMEESASSYLATQWLREPAEVIAGVGQKVWSTHGSYTAEFNSQLEIFARRRAAVIRKLQRETESRATTLAAIATRLATTDEEALWLAYTLDIP